MQLPEPALLDLPGGPIAYRRGGEGPPLVLIHGWGGSARHWLGAFATLADYFDLIAIDLPGFGASPPPPGPASLPGMVAAARAVIASLGLKRVAVAGHSLGAAVALLLADAWPQGVERLALLSFGLPRDPVEEVVFAGLHVQLRASATLWSPWLALWSPWLAAARPWATAYWTTPPLPTLVAGPVLHSPAEVPHEALALGMADLVAMDLRVSVEAATTSGDPSVTAAARRVAAPTLVLAGRGDQLFPPASSAALAQALPVSAHILLDRCGHVPMAERPAELYGLLGSFMLA